MAVIIDKSQYKNFSCKLGKKNKITKVIGKEYLVDTSTKATYTEGNKDCTPSELGGTLYDIGAYADGEAFALFDWRNEYYLRREVHSRKGSYTFVITGKTITHIDKMVANYTLYYNKYTNSSGLIGSGNYSQSYSNNVFSAIRNNNNRPQSSYNEETKEYNEYDYTTKTCIPSYEAVAYYDKIGDTIIEYTDPGGIVPTQYCKVKLLSKTKNKDGVNYDYTFQVDFQFTYATGRNDVAISSFDGKHSHANEYYEVVKIGIEISGFTVSKEKVDSDYCAGNDERYVLELQTNELMQQSIDAVAVGSGHKVISFKDVAAEIITAYKNNRLIATFDLINNRKYTIDGETRYLRAGDKIKIKDKDGNFVSSCGDTENGSEFEIIKANSKYEGFYYREITAKEILPIIASTPETPDVPKFSIGYDTLGAGSNASIEFNCVSEAAAGAQVEFTINVLNAELEVSNLVLQDDDGEELSGLIREGNTYSFTMPAKAVWLMIYLIPIEE